MSRTKGAKGKHHKEKPVKEKKKRGRPSKQHQHQQQKQIVNVNVNGGGGGGGGGSKTIPVPFQLPSTIYDPSLITPHYGINDRQPTNPLTDAATDLMTPFIQSIISNQQKVNRIPISEGDVKPVNPINPKTPTQAIPISQGDVKPVNPVITKPPERYVPNPQTDQSHPIPPEIITDSNFSSLIHNKHMQHKNLQKEITPQVPKIPQPKKKINDPEGLGKIIPFGNIETIAGTVGTAALTGGSSVALEALYTGGTTGLMGAGESILGAGVGSGVAAGLSSALGNSAIGNVISGTVGGFAGRAVGRRITNRLRRPTQPPELQPALGGNRLGGSGSGSSRLVPNEQITYDPVTGAQSTWIIPPEEPISSIRRAANRTMRRAAETVTNLKEQIADAGESIMGTIRRRGRPRSSVFPKSDENLVEDVEGRMRWQNEMRQNEQKRNATNRLKASFKRKKEENTITLKKIANENDLLEQQNATNRIKAAFKRKKEENTIPFQKIANENDQLMETLQKQQNQAASKLQDAIRRKLPLNTPSQDIQNKMLAWRKREKQDKINKGRDIVENMKQKQYNTYLQDEAASNFGALSKGVVKQQKKALQQQLKQVQGHQLLKDIKSDNTAINFEFMSGDSLRQQRKGIRKQIQETRDKQIGTAINKYNKIGDMIATRNETPMVLGETAPSRFIQSAARFRKKALQSEISHVDSRVYLATKQQKEARIQRANEGIKRMDNIIIKKTAAGRPRTRSEQEISAPTTPLSRRNSRLSVLSTTSTLGSFTPTPKKK